jgi:FkbM family methyltransferase
MILPQIFTAKIRRRFNSYFPRNSQYNLLASQKDSSYKFSLPDGSRFDYPINTSIGRELYNGGFEISEVEFLRQSIKPGNVLLDIGANGGLFTVIAAKIIGDKGHVYACEPGIRELRILRNNIAVNNLNNVTVIDSAIGDKETQTQFAIAYDGALNSLAQTSHPSQEIESWETVNMTTVDALIAKHKIEKVDFLKIDVEGAENLVFKGAKKLLSSAHNLTILFEASELNSHSFGYSVKDLIAQVLAEGFTVKYINKYGIIRNISLDDTRIGREIYNFIAFK